MKLWKPLNKTINYFVSYIAWDNKNQIYGMIDIFISQPIKNFDTIELVLQMIKDKNPTFKDVIILGWQRYN
jgi:hypothetical protein